MITKCKHAVAHYDQDGHCEDVCCGFEPIKKTIKGRAYETYRGFCGDIPCPIDEITQTEDISLSAKLNHKVFHQNKSKEEEERRHYRHSNPALKSLDRRNKRVIKTPSDKGIEWKEGVEFEVEEYLVRREWFNK